MTLLREYNNVIWGPSYTLDNQKLERMQCKATRMIPSINHLSYYDRLRYLNIPSLQHRRQRGDLIYLYQILKGSYDIENHLFTPSTSTVTEVTQGNYSNITLIRIQDLIFIVTE